MLAFSQTEFFEWAFNIVGKKSILQQLSGDDEKSTGLDQVRTDPMYKGENIR